MTAGKGDVDGGSGGGVRDVRTNVGGWMVVVVVNGWWLCFDGKYCTFVPSNVGEDPLQRLSVCVGYNHG